MVDYDGIDIDRHFERALMRRRRRTAAEAGVKIGMVLAAYIVALVAFALWLPR